MKKLFIISLFFIFTINIYSNEISKEIKAAITSEARAIYDNARDRNDFIKWQEESYLELEKTLSNSTISSEEKNRIRAYLRGKYGNNFIKQNAEIEDEISRIKNVEIAIKNSVQEEMIKKVEKEKKELETKNQESKKNLEKIVIAPEIPSELMTRFRSEAERLYPNNFYEQERYLNSSIENFKFYKNLK